MNFGPGWRGEDKAEDLGYEPSANSDDAVEMVAVHDKAEHQPQQYPD